MSTCQLCKKQVVSMFHPDSPHPIYCHDCWDGDGWDPLAYGQEMDFSRPFFEQRHELNLRVPKYALVITECENSDFTSISWKNKDSYFAFGSCVNERLMYAHSTWYTKDSMETSGTRNCELVYQTVDCSHLYNCRYMIQSDNCRDSMFLFDCRGCTDCFRCIHLRNKQYCINNKQYTKEEYHAEVARLLAYRDQMEALYYQGRLWDDLSKMRVYARIVNSEGCTGDNILNSKNSTWCFGVDSIENCKYMIHSYDNTTDSYDCESTDSNAQLMYEGISVAGNNLLFSPFTWFTDFSAYNYMCIYSKYLFGCVSVKHGEYVILNKKYSKQEYEELVPRIIAHMRETGEWGEMFPISMAPFGYNETLAQEFYPISAEHAAQKGWPWRENLGKTTGRETKQHTEIDRDIHHVPETICADILACEDCRKNYRIEKKEFAYYLQHGISIPRKCFDCRYMLRVKLRAPRNLWPRGCQCTNLSHGHEATCPEHFETSFAPQRPELVFGRKCYEAEVL